METPATTKNCSNHPQEGITLSHHAFFGHLPLLLWPLSLSSTDCYSALQCHQSISPRAGNKSGLLCLLAPMAPALSLQWSILKKSKDILGHLTTSQNQTKTTTPMAPSGLTCIGLTSNLPTTHYQPSCLGASTSSMTMNSTSSTKNTQTF